MAERDRYEITRRDQGGMMTPFNDFFTSPFSVMRRMAEEMNQMLNSGIHTGINGMRAMMPGTGMEWPSVDIRETAGSYVVEAEIPGVDARDIDVHMRGDMLVIRGQTHRHEDSQDQGYYISERHYGSFHREIPLPGQVDAEHCNAHYENGVLQVRLPKAESAAGQRIPVDSPGRNSMEGKKMGQTGNITQGGQNSSGGQDDRFENDQVVPGTGERASAPGVEASTADQSYVGQKGGESAKDAAQAFMTEDADRQSGQGSQSGTGSSGSNS